MNTSSGPLLHLMLGVAPRRSGEARCLWSTRVAPMGQSAQAPAVCTDPEILKQRFGAPCQAGMEAIVPRDLVGQMTASMHLAMALHLRQLGQRAAADSVEQAWGLQRQAATHR